VRILAWLRPGAHMLRTVPTRRTASKFRPSRLKFQSVTTEISVCGIQFLCLFCDRGLPGGESRGFLHPGEPGEAEGGLRRVLRAAKGLRRGSGEGPVAAGRRLRQARSLGILLTQAQLESRLPTTQSRAPPTPRCSPSRPLPFRPRQHVAFTKQITTSLSMGMIGHSMMMMMILRGGVLVRLLRTPLHHPPPPSLFHVTDLK